MKTTNAPTVSAEKVIYGYCYPSNGNMHNPTPRVYWRAIVGGVVVGEAETKRGALIIAKEEAASMVA